jgi:DNA gyrase/topoisomerase IV subunit A
VIKSSKIQEWIKEIEERPMIAPFIVRRLSDRLVELDALNEELRSENLLLRSGQKVEEYERKIAELEYQIELLKRQRQDGAPTTRSEIISLLIYDTAGRVLARQFNPKGLQEGNLFATLQNLGDTHSDDIHLLAVTPQDELVFLMDTGRVATQMAGAILQQPDANLDWDKAFQLELRSGERLVSIAPITHAPLAEQCIQITRKGFARSFQKDLFQTFLSRRNLGKGIKLAADQLFTLTLCSTADIFVLVSRSGFISAIPASKLSISLEEVMRLDPQDYLVSAFIIQSDDLLVIAAQDGEILIQKNPWVDPADANGVKRRILSRSKAGGMRVIGAGAGEIGGWAFLLNSQGEIYAQSIGDEASAKASKHIAKEASAQIMAFTVCEALEPENKVEG